MSEDPAAYGTSGQKTLVEKYSFPGLWKHEFRNGPLDGMENFTRSQPLRKLDIYGPGKNWEGSYFRLVCRDSDHRVAMFWFGRKSPQWAHHRSPKS